MNNKVDKLFKEKLEAHSLPPSAQAWEKLEAQLSKKNRTVIWFRVAAVVGLAGLLTFALLQQKENAIPSPLTQQKDTVMQDKKIAPAIVLKEKETIILIEKKHSLTKRNATPRKTESKQEDAITNIQPEENSIAQATEEKIIETAPSVTTAPTKKPMKLTFSLPAIESKNAAKEEVIVAIVPEQKKTTLQKAADVAYEIRTGEVLGNLREAKNDLFALEFKKDKTKKQQ